MSIVNLYIGDYSMNSDKNMQLSNYLLLILKLIEKEDMYGYEIINTLRKKSDFTFHQKAGDIYPILHKLENDKLVKSYEKTSPSKRVRKYYKITKKGINTLKEREQEWAVHYSPNKKYFSLESGDFIGVR